VHEMTVLAFEDLWATRLVYSRLQCCRKTAR